MANTIIHRQQVLPPDVGKDYEFNFIPSETARRCLLYRTSVGRMCPSPRYHIERKRFDSYLFMYVLTGVLTCTTEKQSYTINEGEAVLINCYHPHIYTAPVEGDFYWTHFDGSGAQQIFFNLSPDDTACVFTGNKADMIGRFLTLSFYNSPVCSLCETEYSRELYSVLMSLCEAEYENPEPERDFTSDFVNSVDYYIRSNYKNNITLRDIARFAEVSESTLSKEYKKMTGITPYAALMKYRISVSCRLLRSTNMPIGEIAESIGYNNLAYFTYGFKREVGMTPSEYRAQNNMVF